jgi:hypothetical protein
VETLLVNLGSGAIGALLGAFAAYRLQIRESQKLSKGASRAVYLELTTNLTTLQGGARAEGPLIGAFTRDTWQAEQARLASYLPPEHLMKVSYAYALFPNGQTALETMRRGGPGAFAEERWMLNHVASAVANAAESMRPLVWSPGEQKRLDELAADVRRMLGS